MPVDAGLISPIGLAGEAYNYSKMLPDFAAQEVQRRELALRGQQEQRLSYEQQSKEARLAQYHAELADLQNITDPAKRTEAISRFMMKWPEFSNENKAAYEVGEQGRNKANLERVGSIVNAMDSNPDLAIQLMDENWAAEAAAGHEPDRMMGQMIADFKSGDETKMNRARATANIILAKAIGTKEYGNAMGIEPTEFDRKMASMNKIRPDDTSLGAQYARTLAAGQLAPAFEPGTQNVIGAYSLGDLPRLGGRPAPAQPTAPTVTSAGGTPVQPSGKDEATGLTKVTSDKWPPGTFVYLTHSKQEFDRVPSGAQYYANDGKLYVKP